MYQHLDPLEPDKPNALAFSHATSHHGAQIAAPEFEPLAGNATAASFGPPNLIIIIALKLRY